MNTALTRSILSHPDFSRDEYEDRLEYQLRRIEQDPRALELERRSCAADKLYFLSRHFKHEDIKTTRAVRLLANDVQLALEANQSDFNVILKSRKTGASTWIDATIFWETLFRPHLRSVIISYDVEATQQLFDRLKFAHDNLPHWLKQPVERSTKKELIFSRLHSSIRTLTAGNTRIGRGSDIDRLHLSEGAFYPNLRQIRLGAGEALRPGARVWWESTPNGYNEFRELYIQARQGAILTSDGERIPGIAEPRAHFFPWWTDARNAVRISPELRRDIDRTLTPEERILRDSVAITAEQFAWRRNKQRELGDQFLQEYPEDDETCFLTSGSPKFNIKHWRSLLVVVEARVVAKPFHVLIRKHPRVVELDDGHLTIWEEPKPGHSYTLGADPSGGVGRDFAHGGVLDVTDLSRRIEVAEYHNNRIEPGDFGVKLAEIASFYNRALLIIERNNHGHATIYAARTTGKYWRLYRHRELHQQSGKQRQQYGFPTSIGTRLTLLDKFQRSVLANEHLVRSKLLCRECLTFQVGDEDLAEDDPRRAVVHDDSVFGWALADFAAVRAGQIAVA